MGKYCLAKTVITRLAVQNKMKYIEGSDYPTKQA